LLGPISVSRKSRIVSHPLCIGVSGNDREQTASAVEPRSPTLSQTVRRCGHSPITVSQRSRIEANCPRRRAIALTHSRRLYAAAGAAPSPFLDGPKSVPSTARVKICASVGVAGYRRSANRPRRRAVALPHSRRLCAAAGAAPSPFLDGPKSVPSTAHANMHASIGV
jgi:hypothetical protein